MALGSGNASAQGVHALPGVPLATGHPIQRHTSPAYARGSRGRHPVAAGLLVQPAAFKGKPKAQAGRALGEEQVQMQVQVQTQAEGSATAAPLLCRPQVWTIPSRPPRAAARRANDES